MDVEKEGIGIQAPYSHSTSTPHQSAKPTAGVSFDDPSSNPQHALFCRMVGMPEHFDTQPSPSIWNVFSRKQKSLKGIYPRTVKAYQWHTFQYWLVASMSNSILWTQICLGAVLTALGGLKTDRVSVAIIVLGAIQTVFGGFATYFKSRNQPNRARQFRIGLKRVLDAIENAENMLRDAHFVPPPYTPLAMMMGTRTSPEGTITGAMPNVEVRGVEGMVLRLMDMYQEAIQEAENNYPDFWKVNNRAADQGQFMMMKDLLDHLKGTGAAVVTNNGTKPARHNSDASARISDPEDAGNVDHTQGSKSQVMDVSTRSGPGETTATVAQHLL